MKFFRKHKIFSIISIILLCAFIVVVTTFGRYIRNIIHNFILETKAFYFNSSVLNVNGKNFSIYNWDGVNTYTLTIDLNNRKNEERHTTTDIVYDITVSCPDTVQCTSNKSSGTIRPEDSTDTYQITITPINDFHAGDSVTISTSVTSRVPYVKTMSANYTIGVESNSFGYEIVDAVNEKFFNINFTNAISYYEVSEAFGDYKVGDRVSIDEFNELSSVDKDKCFSAIVTISFDPTVVFLDMSDDAYLNRLDTGYEEKTINGYKWVSKISFKVNPSSSKSVLFYKNDITKNYTYPIVNSKSIIDVSAKLAN